MDRRVVIVVCIALLVGLLTNSTQANSAETSLPPPDREGKGWIALTTDERTHPNQFLKTLNLRAPSFALFEETESTPHIQALVRGLENDPELIYEYVRNHIDYVPTFGSMNDATAVMLAGRGNDLDQASLFIALMREAGFTANYRMGEVKYALADLANWFGVDNTPNAVGNLLGNAGYPLAFDGVTFSFVHVYAEAEIDGMTFVFDPSFKQFEYFDPVDVDAVTSYDRATFLADMQVGATVSADSVLNLNEANVQANLDMYTMELVDHIRDNMIDAEIEEILGGRSIIHEDLTAFSTVLPDAISVVNESTFATVPDTLRNSVQLQFEGIDQTFFFHELSSRRLTMSYNASNRPELRLDGTLMGTGNVTTPDTFSLLDVTIDHIIAANGGAFADQAGQMTLRNGQFYGFLYDWNTSSAENLRYHRERLVDILLTGGTNEEILGQTAALYAHIWNLETRLNEHHLEEILNYTALRQHSFGVVRTGDGHGVDIPFAFVTPLDESGLAINFDGFRAGTIASSVHEGGVLEQMQAGVNAVSTVRLLQEANAQGLEIFIADNSNWMAGSNVRSQLVNYGASDLALFDAQIGAGFTAILPQDGSIIVDDYSGYGSIVFSNSTIQMLITGGLFGGDSTSIIGLNEDQLLDNLNRLLNQSFTDADIPVTSTNGEPVEMERGNYVYGATDLALGAGDLFGIRFQRTYNSAKRFLQDGTAPLGNGWSHNHEITANRQSNGLLALGFGRNVEAAATAVANHIMADLLEGVAAPDLLEWMGSDLTGKWLMDQLTDNVIVVEAADFQADFVELPDGDFTSPGPSPARLSEPANIEVQVDGETLTFNSDGLLTQRQDSNGITITYTYNGNDELTNINTSTGYGLTLAYTGGRITSVTDMAGRTVNYSYDADGNLIDYTDAESNIWGYDYNADNRLTEVFVPTDPINPVVTNTYDGVGQVMQQTTGEGDVFTLLFSRFRNVEVNPDGSRSIHHYDAKGRWIGREDSVGNRTDMEYDGLNRLVKLTDREGREVIITYDNAPSRLISQPATITDPEGNMTTFTYSERGTSDIFDLTRIDYADGTNQQAVYDADGNLTQRTDKAGMVTTITYNANGQPLTITNPDSGVRTFTYNPDGTLATSTDSDTGVTTYTYDAFKRRTQVTFPDATTRTFMYDAEDRLLTRTDAGGDVTTFTYSDDGQVLTRTDPAGEVTTFAYDGIGRLTDRTDRAGNLTTFSYDGLNRIDTITDPVGLTTEFVIDTLDRVTSITRNGTTGTFTYDNEGILKSITDPLGLAVTMGHDDNGNITSITNALNETDTFTYDERDRLTTATDALARTVTYAYNSRGLLSGVTFPILGATSYTYDDTGQLDTITDLRGNDWLFDYTDSGRLSSATDPLSNVETYTYDDLGRLEATTFADGTTATITRNADGLITQLTYSDGTTTLNNTYNDLDNLLTTNNLAFTYDEKQRVINTENSPPGVAPNDFGTTYDDAGRVETVSYNNGAVTVTYTYNAMGQLAQVTDSLTGATLDFTYDLSRRLSDITRSNGQNTAYTYNNGHRLSRIQSGAFLDLQYTFDDAGQITSLDMLAPLTPDTFLVADNETHTWDAANQNSGAGYAFDDRGRATADPNNAYTWDARTLTNIDSVSLEYNGLGDLMRRTEAGVTTAYHYNHGIKRAPIMAEQDVTSGSLDRLYVWTPGGHLLYMVDLATNEVYFYHFDNTGNVLALTDDTGAVVEAYAYSPYGRLLGSLDAIDQPFTFVGLHGVRQEGNIYEMGVRYYDPESIHFLSREPKWPLIENPRMLNPYQYAYDNPISFIDWSGREPENSNGGGFFSSVYNFFFGKDEKLAPSASKSSTPTGNTTPTRNTSPTQPATPTKPTSPTQPATPTQPTSPTKGSDQIKEDANDGSTVPEVNRHVRVNLDQGTVNGQPFLKFFFGNPAATFTPPANVGVLPQKVPKNPLFESGLSGTNLSSVLNQPDSTLDHFKGDKQQNIFNDGFPSGDTPAWGGD